MQETPLCNERASNLSSDEEEDSEILNPTYD